MAAARSGAQHRQFMAEHYDLHLLEVAGANQKNNQLKHALKRNVADEQEHDASGIKTPGYSTQIEFVHPTRPTGSGSCPYRFQR